MRSQTRLRSVAGRGRRCCRPEVPFCAAKQGNGLLDRRGGQVLVVGDRSHHLDRHCCSRPREGGACWRSVWSACGERESAYRLVVSSTSFCNASSWSVSGAPAGAGATVGGLEVGELPPVRVSRSTSTRTMAAAPAPIARRERRRLGGWAGSGVGRAGLVIRRVAAVASRRVGGVAASPGGETVTGELFGFSPADSRIAARAEAGRSVGSGAVRAVMRAVSLGAGCISVSSRRTTPAAYRSAAGPGLAPATISGAR